jgi:nickel-dependent lactate racemase
MKSVLLKYGREGLEVQVPENSDVYRPAWKAPLADEQAAIRHALIKPIGSPPLRDILLPHMRVVLVHTDLTRATPNTRLLPPILAEVLLAGVSPGRITLINALGSHRMQTDEEMTVLLGQDLLRYYRCVQHDAFDESSTAEIAKTGAGQSIRINRAFIEADFRILTGFIEPHFFAGFSGGPKLVLPGLADLETIQWNHRVESIASPRATWGVTAGNPIWEEMRAVAKRFDPIFNVNVTLNDAHRITGVFCGDLLASHAAGCEFVRKQCLFEVPAPYDLVVTTNGGYPLDQNLYQAVKGISAAAQITRPGGRILMAAACEDGLPNHGAYARLLEQVTSPKNLMDSILHGAQSGQDLWQVQKQAELQTQFDVSVFSDGLSSETIQKALYYPICDINEEISQVVQKDPNVRIAVLPEGPQSIGCWLEKMNRASSGSEEM